MKVTKWKVSSRRRSADQSDCSDKSRPEGDEWGDLSAIKNHNKDENKNKGEGKGEKKKKKIKITVSKTDEPNDISAMIGVWKMSPLPSMNELLQIQKLSKRQAHMFRLQSLHNKITDRENRLEYLN